MVNSGDAIAVKDGKKDGKFKEKLRRWYVNYVARNGNSIKKLYDARTTAQNTAGAIVLGILAPELLPLVPAIQKGNKKLNDLKYNIGKGAIHKGLGIKEGDVEVKPASEALDSLTDENVGKVTQAITDKLIEKQGGRSR